MSGIKQLKLNEYIEILKARQKKYGNLPLIYATDTGWELY